MPIHYYLRENQLTEVPNDFMAIAISSNQYDLEDVVKQMIKQGSTVTRPDILSVVDDFNSAIETLLEQGATIVTPIVSFRPSIRGVFDGIDDTYDPSRHQIMININPGKRLRSYLNSGISTQKERRGELKPELDRYIDANSGEENSLLTPGGMGTIKGDRLDYDVEDPLQGIFLIAEDGTETKVEIVGQKRPSVMRFIIPVALTKGEYVIKIRTKPGKKIREGLLSSPLQVT